MTNSLLDRDQFQRWKDSPLTQGFLAYLRDRQSDLTRAWGKGLVGSNLPEVQAQAVVLGQLAEISFEDLQQQYVPDTEQVREAEQ